MAAYVVDPSRPDWQAEHLRRYLATDGADGYYVDFRRVGGPELTPTLILTTKGRRSGQTQSLPLIFGESGKDYVIKLRLLDAVGRELAKVDEPCDVCTLKEADEAKKTKQQ